MDRKGLEQLIFDTYSVEPDYPWMDTPESAVFRHAANRKWFALVTTVPKSKLGLPGQQPVDIVNLKCDPILIGSLRAEPGFYPAYHMNKENWITAALAIATAAILWRFKKLPEPVIVIAAALIGLVVHPLVTHS